MTKKGTQQYIEDSKNQFILIYRWTNSSSYRARMSLFDSGFLLGDGV